MAHQNDCGREKEKGDTTAVTWKTLVIGLVALGSVAHGGVAVPAHHGATGAHDALVHRRLHAVVLLDVQLGKGVVVEHRRLADITEGGSVHDVPARGVENKGQQRIQHIT